MNCLLFVSLNLFLKDHKSEVTNANLIIYHEITKTKLSPFFIRSKKKEKRKRNTEKDKGTKNERLGEREGEIRV